MNSVAQSPLQPPAAAPPASADPRLIHNAAALFPDRAFPLPAELTPEGGFRIQMPAARSCFQIGFRGCIVGFGALALIAYGVGLVVAIVSEKSPPDMVAGLVAFGFIMVFGELYAAWSLLILLWNLRGQEIVEVQPGRLFVHTRLFGRGRTRSYSVSEIMNLRIGPLEGRDKDNSALAGPWGADGGRIHFEHRKFRQFVGAGISEEEAWAVLTKVGTYFYGFPPPRA